LTAAKYKLRVMNIT